jgi:hypothetical protein
MRGGSKREEHLGVEPLNSVRIRRYTARMTDLGKFGKSLALVLVFWCAGTGCTLVSYATAGGTPVADSASGPSDGMTAAPSCHEHRQKNRKTASKTAAADRVEQVDLPMPSRSAALSCCPLTSGSIAAAYRPQSHNSAPALTNSESQILNLAHLTAAPVAVPTRLPDRAHSYLLDCTFRI